MHERARIGILLIHGMGSQGRGYSEPLQAALRAKLGAEAGRFVFEEVAHSLGAHVLSNYVWDTEPPLDGETKRPDPRWQPLPTLTSIVTFGANIPLFSLPFDRAVPVCLPAVGVPEGPLRKAGRWLDFFDADDILGWPVRALYERDRDRIHPGRRPTIDRIRDRAIAAGPPLTGMTPLSHGHYWSDGGLAGRTASHLRQLAATQGK